MRVRQQFFSAPRGARLVVALVVLCFIVGSTMSYSEELNWFPSKQTQSVNTKKTQKKNNKASSSRAQSQETEKKSGLFADAQNEAKKRGFVVRNNPTGFDVKKGDYGVSVGSQIKSGPNRNTGGLFSTFSLEF